MWCGLGPSHTAVLMLFVFKWCLSFALCLLSHRRIMRSNSVTAAVQADLDIPDFSPTESPDADITFSRDATASTVSIQGSGNHYHACTSDDYSSVGFDPSVLPPPEPWVDSGIPEDPLQSARSRSVCQRDGRWFLKLLQAEAERMEGWCRQMEQEERRNELPDDSESPHTHTHMHARFIVC